MIGKYQTNPNKRKLLKIGLQNRDVIKIKEIPKNRLKVARET